MHASSSPRSCAPHRCRASRRWLRRNALARQVVQATDRATSITASHVEAAKEALILRRDTHLDSLTDRLRDPRVRRVIEPIVAGAFPDESISEDDIESAKDLGLIAVGPAGLGIANPIYREVIWRNGSPAARSSRVAGG